jgi:hypothetical protein
MKKGPKRVKKTLAQLDQEMEDYRATLPTETPVKMDEAPMMVA